MTQITTHFIDKNRCGYTVKGKTAFAICLLSLLFFYSLHGSNYCEIQHHFYEHLERKRPYHCALWCTLV